MCKILVIDDEQEIIRILEEFLAKMGFDLITAVGGEKAIEIINSQAKIDLIVLDMKMPKVKGIDVLKELRRAGRQNPVIILTGSIDAQKHRGQLSELGYNPDDICYKPIDLYVLLDMIKKKLPKEPK